MKQPDERGEKFVPRWSDRLDLLILNPDSPDYAWHWQRLLESLRNPPARRPVPFTVPALPGEFVHRHRLEQQILNLPVAAAFTDEGARQAWLTQQHTALWYGQRATVFRACRACTKA